MVTRRNFLAAAAAVAAAPIQVLAVPVGGPLRVPSGFTKGKAIPAGFDFRDPLTGLLMQFGAWYVVSESGLAELPGGYETPQAAYSAFLDDELKRSREWLAELRAGREAGTLPEHIAKNYEQNLAWALRDEAAILDAMQSPVVPTQFTDKPGYCAIDIMGYDVNHMACSVTRGDMQYAFSRTMAAGEEWGGGPDLLADFERAQNDSAWSGMWGGN